MYLFDLWFIRVTLIDVIDLLLVTWLFYRVYKYFHETRAGQMLLGLVILLVASVLFNSVGLSASSWVVNQFQTVWVVAFVILFQPEIRRLLIYVGQTRFFRRIFQIGSSRTIEAIVEASIQLTVNKWGALIVIQRETGLRTYKDAGTELKAEVTAPLLLSIFNPGSPLHDGAVIMNFLNIPMTSPILQKIGLAFCAERGPTYGGNPLSREKAFKFARTFMTQHLLNN